MAIAYLGYKVDSSQVALAEKRLDGMSRAAGSAGRAAAQFLALAGAAFSAGAIVNGIAQFETSMSRVGAVSRASASDLAAMRDIAKQLGSTTEFSASQAADGLNFLAMAGFDAREAMAALPDVLDLATASGMGLAESADIASNVISGFGMDAQDAAKVADVLAAASSRANTDVSQLGRAMSTVAPISASLGISLEDTASAIGVLSDAGIQGERAGTALRGVMASLAGPTKAAADALAAYGISVKDVNPETHSLAEIFKTLQERGLSTADAMTIFGREAASGALALIDANARVGELADELRAAEGAAGDMANTMRDNLGGDLKGFVSAVEGLILSLGEAGLTAVIRGVVQVATTLVRVVSGIIDTFGRAVNYVSEFAREIFGIKTAQEITQAAIDNVSIAMGDQINASRALSATLRDGVTMSLEMAQAELSEAEARRATVQTLVDKRREAELVALGYFDLLSQIGDVQSALNSLRAPGDDLEQMPLKMRDAYEETEQSLVALLARQREMLDAVSDRNHLTEQEAEHLKTVEGNIAALQSRIAEFNASKVESVVLSQRLAVGVSSINFSNAVAGAQSLAKSLGVTIHQAMRLMGLLGAAAQAAGDGVEFDPRSPRYDAAAAESAAKLERIKNIMGDLGKQTQVVIPGVTGVSNALRGISVAASGGGGGGGSKGASGALSDTAKEVARLNEAAKSGRTPMQKYAAELAKLNDLRKAGLTDAAYSVELERMNEELANSIPMVNDVANAFGDFVARGFKDFKGFAQSILKSFTSMIAQMVATAARNRIIIGLGAVASPTAAVAGGVGGIGGGGLLSGIGSKLLGSFGGAGVAGTGFLGGLGSSLSGGIGGIFNIGANAAAAGGGIMATIGAAVPIIGAVGLIAGLFKKKVKELDNGVQVAINQARADVDTFRRIETSRFFGLSKKKTTEYESASSSVTRAIQASVDGIQSSVLEAAKVFGFTASNFKGFSYQFKLSLKDMDQSQRMAAISAELAKMGDRFAAMLPKISSLNELMAAAGQRYDLETRLLELQGDSAALLARQRERELAATHALNVPLLEQIWALEDQAAALERINGANGYNFGATRYEAEMIAAAQRRGEISFARSGPGASESEADIRLEKLEENSEMQARLMQRLVDIWEGFRANGVPLEA